MVKDQRNKWQKELEQLSKKTYQATDEELFGAYKQALSEIKLEVKAYLDDYEKLSFSKKLEVDRKLQAGKQIDEVLYKLSDKTHPTIRNYLKAEAEQGYYGTFYDLEQANNLSINFNLLTQGYIERITDKKIAGKNLSKLLYQKRNRLGKLATNALTVGAAKGDDYKKIAKNIGELTEASYKQALRIARTEGGRAQSTAKQKGYEEAVSKGIDLKKKWLSTLDEKTRSSHQHLDGQIIEIDEKFQSGKGKAEGPRMFGVAREDINCRCTTVTVVNGYDPALERKDNVSSEVIKAKNYEEWLNARK